MVAYILYNYAHHCGGIGDFFRFFVHSWEVAQEHQLLLLVWIEHPLAQYLVVKKKELVYQMDKSYRQVCQPIPKMIRERYDAILIRPSDFYATSYLPCSFPNKIDFPITEYFDFVPSIHALAETSRPTTCFDSLHVRCGDMYLETKPSWNPCPKDDRYPRNLPKKILQILEDIDTVLLLCSDNEHLKETMKEQFPQILTMDTTIIHTGLRYKDKRLFDQGLVDTLVEFLVMSYSRVIHTTSNSGFPQMAHLFSPHQDQVLVQW